MNQRTLERRAVHVDSVTSASTSEKRRGERPGDQRLTIGKLVIITDIKIMLGVLLEARQFIPRVRGERDAGSASRGGGWG